MLNILARSGTPVDVLDKEYGAGETWKGRWSPLFDAALIRHYEHATRYAAQKQIVRTEVPFSEIHDQRFVTRALSDLNLGSFWSAVAAAEPVVR